MLTSNSVLSVLLPVALLIGHSSGCAQEYLTGKDWAKPSVVTPGETDSQPPSDAIVLFNGKDLDNWQNGDNWTVKNGVIECGSGVLTSNETFGDCQLHIEWSAPTPPKGNGQGRGNSGLFMMGRYEMQILDSYDNETYPDGQAASIYKQTPPMANATRPPGDWNNYDVIWTTPVFNDDGTLKSPAYITAIHNGVVVLNHFALLGDTPFNRAPQYNQHDPVGPIALQDHGNPVRFRNIWVRPLTPPSSVQVRKPYLRDGDKETELAE